MENAIGTSAREGFGTLTPYLMVDSVDPVVHFLKDAFGARETYRSVGSQGGLHCEVQIGDSRLMMGGDSPNRSSSAVPTMLFLYVQDTDAVYQAALAAGATSVMEPGKNFEEQRGAAVKDPFGNTFFIATHDPTTSTVSKST